MLKAEQQNDGDDATGVDHTTNPQPGPSQVHPSTEEEEGEVEASESAAE